MIEEVEHSKINENSLLKKLKQIGMKSYIKSSKVV